MSTPVQVQSQREALEITMWAQGRQAPPRELLAALKLLGLDGRVLADGSQEAGVGNAYGGDDSGLPVLGPLEPFGSWQSVAATILRKTADSASFNQSLTIFELIRWINFEFQFKTIPFLKGVTSDSRSASISSLSLRLAISVVTELVGGLVTSDTLTGIINSIKKIGQLAVENEGLQEKNTNVHQGVLTVVNGDLRLGRLRTTVQMKYETGKGYQQLNQQITVSRLFGSLDYDMCIRNAETLLKWERQNVDDWANDTSSSPYRPNESPAWDN
ncbi:hypothetical protein N8J89_18425 [Crossiella sp. CA-258035]|uniref:hypothetical protein n=1 Tax=Crossiella sp. CA-258035 TaxID=2981138 RepID=UPI0024BC04DD|nr:hypothetical protein [Crossiella sp. CA-258035]WHT22968.1 hypothetical protein N8J89_18425 [Crossiella sp. CA-258035]